MSDPVPVAVVLGDSHGALDHVVRGVRRASMLGVPLYHVGDFGYWLHTRRGREFMDGLEAALDKYGVVLTFIDGNHENHSMLIEMGDLMGATPGGPPVQVSPGGKVFWAHRGSRWEEGGLQFLGLGGAYSVDKFKRVGFVSWWPQELIEPDQAAAAILGGPCDVLLCHDVPWMPPCQEAMWVQQGRELWPNGDTPEGLASRQLLADVVRAVLPRVVVHGHMHIRYSAGMPTGGTVVPVEGLSHDGDYDSESCAVLMSDCTLQPLTNWPVYF